jgi:hypothetical protein
MNLGGTFQTSDCTLDLWQLDGEQLLIHMLWSITFHSFFYMRSFIFPHVLLFEVSVILCIDIVYVFTIYNDYIFGLEDLD